jgi:hypothetical protein
LEVAVTLLTLVQLVLVEDEAEHII